MNGARELRRRVAVAIWIGASSVLFCVQPLSAQEDASRQDEIGFGDSSEPAPPASATSTSDDIGFGPSESPAPTGEFASEPLAASEPSPWTLSASLRFRAAARVEAATPSRASNLAQALEPRLEFRDDWGALAVYARASFRTEVDFAYLWDPDVYDLATRETYAWQVIPGESYVSLGSGPVELRVGEQIVNFGQGEVLSVIDVLNPRDVREPLLRDIGEQHLPLLITRAKLGFTRINAEIAVAHEAYFGLLPPPLGEFSPFRKLLLDNPAFAAAFMGRTLRNASIPGHSVTELGASQVMGRVAWAGSAVDVALVGGSLLDSIGVPSLPAATAFASQAIDFPMLHPRYTLLGHTGAFTFGSFILRWEAAVELDRALALRRVDRPLELSAQRRTDLRGLLGLTYAPSPETSAALELVQSYVLDNPERRPELGLRPLFPVEATQLALRVNHQFLRDRASFSLFALLVGLTRFNAFAGRAELAYQILDTLSVSLGYVMYVPSDGFGYFYGFERHDRVFLTIRWDVST